jgi:TolA-binding protein
MEQRRWKDASKAFQQALAIDPKHQKARKNLIEAEKRMPLPTVIELKPFESNQKEVMNLKPNQTANRVTSPTISKGIEVIGGSVDIGRKPVNSLNQNKAKRISEAFNDALARLKNRRYSEALDMFQWLLKQPANVDTLSVCEYWIGECYLGMGNLPKARTAFSRVISYGDFAKRRDAILMLKRIASAERTVTKSAKG